MLKVIEASHSRQTSQTSHKGHRNSKEAVSSKVEYKNLLVCVHSCHHSLTAYYRQADLISPPRISAAPPPATSTQMLKESVELHAPAVVKCDEAHRCTSPGPLALAVSVEDGMGWVVLRSEAKYAKLSIDVPAFGSEVFLFYRTRLLVRARHGAMKMWIMAYTFTQTRYTKSMFV